MAKRPIHNCAAKKRFGDKPSALARAKPGLTAYRCPACGGFHLTSAGAPANPPGEKSDLDEKPAPFEVPILLRASGGPRGSARIDRKIVVASCAAKPKRNGIVRVRVDGREFETTEPVQPANLRHVLSTGVRVKLEISFGKPFFARVIGVN